MREQNWTGKRGLYRLDFDDTTLEGTYKFRFHVRGTTEDGVAFSRTRTFSEYVKIEPDGRSTVADFDYAGVSHGQRTADVYVLPRDRFGNYVGPMAGAPLEFQTTAGTWDGPVIDHGNGYYSRKLIYDIKDKPRVHVLYGDQRLAQVKFFKQWVINPYVGVTFFGGDLDLDHGISLGAEIGYRITENLVLGLDLAWTPTKNDVGDSGSMFHGLVNLRYEIPDLRFKGWTPYVSAGVGAAAFRSLGKNDEAVALQAGGGLRYPVGSNLDFKVEGRALWLGDAMDSGSSLNGQVSANLEYSF
jgi:opacity protein-like surface antigen